MKTWSSCMCWVVPNLFRIIKRSWQEAGEDIGCWYKTLPLIVSLRHCFVSSCLSALLQLLVCLTIFSLQQLVSGKTTHFNFKADLYLPVFSITVREIPMKEQSTAKVTPTCKWATQTCKNIERHNLFDYLLISDWNTSFRWEGIFTQILLNPCLISFISSPIKGNKYIVPC